MIIDGWQHDTQILTWVLSYDKSHPTEALSICSASAATAISEVPMHSPIAGVEVGFIDGNFIVNPTKAEMKNSTLALTLAGTKNGILMIEGAAEFLTEEQMVEALNIGHEAIGVICDAIDEFKRIAGKDKKVDTLRRLPSSLVDNMDKLYGAKIIDALSVGEKNSRGAAVGLVEEQIVQRFVRDIAPAAATKLVGNKEIAEKSSSGAPLVEYEEDDFSPLVSDDDSGDLKNGNAVAAEDEASELTIASEKVARLKNKVAAADIEGVGYNYDPIDVKVAIKKLLVRKLREIVQKTGRRSDGRGVEDVRPIDIETSLLPGAHGSALFTRGETQSVATATLGSKSMEARFETLDELGAKGFYLQYRFPPSSVGEVGRVGGVNRREVGHGNLAERALIPALPSSTEFPYSIRAESLITESSGSSSMASVCGCCLAMLDAGVPLKTLVAGIAMGLILGEKQGDSPVILTDILGLEDALGTMDFKVAGNETGITTFQLDIKSEGLTKDILRDALLQAKRGRLRVLQEMKAALSSPRKLKDTIPRLLAIKVPPETLGKVIGPKGKTVQSLVETYGVTNINIEDDGTIQIESFSDEKNDACKEAVLKIVEEASNNDSAGGDRSARGRGGPRGGGDRDDKAPKKEIGPPPEEGLIYR